MYVKSAFFGSERLRSQGGNPFGIPGPPKGRTATARIEDSRCGTARKMNSCQSEKSCQGEKPLGFSVWPLARLPWLNQRFRQGTAGADFRRTPLVEKPEVFQRTGASPKGAGAPLSPRRVSLGRKRFFNRILRQENAAQPCPIFSPVFRFLTKTRPKNTYSCATISCCTKKSTHIHI